MSTSLRFFMEYSQLITDPIGHPWAHAAVHLPRLTGSPRGVLIVPGFVASDLAGRSESAAAVGAIQDSNGEYDLDLEDRRKASIEQIHFLTPLKKRKNAENRSA
jgi:hypothetical protein